MEKLFENFTGNILKLNKLIQKIKQLESQKYGLKAIHIMCVYYLNENPEGLTSSELVKLTLEDKAAISRALKLMQEKGLVKHDANRHNCIIKLTEAGFKLADFILDRSAKAVAAGSAQLTEEQRVFFYEVLGSIAGNLETYYVDLIKTKKSKT